MMVPGITLTRRRSLARRDANTIAGFDMEHLDTFLARHPPFDGIPPGELRDFAADAVERQLEPGAVVLIEDGPPTSGLWVLLTGSMDLVHQGEVIQVLEPGEVVIVIPQNRRGAFEPDQPTTSSGTRDLATMSAAVSATPGPFRSTAATPAFCSASSSAGSRSLTVTITTVVVASP